MSENYQDRLFCTKCSLKFGINLARFSTIFGFKIHKSIAHKEENLGILENKARKCVKLESYSAMATNLILERQLFDRFM